MTKLKFTAAIVKKDKGSYVAGAVELPIMAEPATTQRGAIRKLKDAVLARLREEADRGTLETFLDDAGYAGHMRRFPRATLQSYAFNNEEVFLALPRQPKQKAAGEGESHAG